MRRILLAGVTVLATILAACSKAPAPKMDGLWDAVIVMGGVEIPFRYEIATNGTQAQGFFFEGDQKVGSTSGSIENGVLKVQYDYLNSTLEAKLDGDDLRGAYTEVRRGNRVFEVRAHRFTPAPANATDTAPQVAGNWEMRRAAAEATAPSDMRTWKLYLRQSGSEVSGSILRVDGDTGTLSGHWANGKLVLSHFTGEPERPDLFEATQNPDGTMNVLLNREANYLAVRTADAAAKGIPDPPDPARYTSVKDPTAPFHFSFPDINGKLISNTDAQFQGKVVLLAIGGSWCPNCQDEAPFLVELYNKYHAQGLEIVGLMFEDYPDPADAWPRVQRFMHRYGIQYTMLLAGIPDQLTDKLPQLVHFGAYPTTIYLGRDGRVRSVHAGFASAATGEEHARLEGEVTELIERLLTENAPANQRRSAAVVR